MCVMTHCHAWQFQVLKRTWIMQRYGVDITCLSVADDLCGINIHVLVFAAKAYVDNAKIWCRHCLLTLRDDLCGIIIHMCGMSRTHSDVGCVAVCVAVCVAMCVAVCAAVRVAV